MHTTTERHCFFLAILSYRSNNGHCLWHCCTQRCFQEKTIKWAGALQFYELPKCCILSCQGQETLHLWILIFYFNCLEKIIHYTNIKCQRLEYVRLKKYGAWMFKQYCRLCWCVICWGSWCVIMKLYYSGDSWNTETHRRKENNIHTEYSFKMNS